MAYVKKTERKIGSGRIKKTFDKYNLFAKTAYDYTKATLFLNPICPTLFTINVSWHVRKYIVLFVANELLKSNYTFR